MRESLAKEYGSQLPRAIVLDDDQKARAIMTRALQRTGFEVAKCKSFADFRDVWKPGMADVIVADWQLSHIPEEHGDRVLEWVRSRDWDVSFVLISGRLGEAEPRVEVVEKLLESGGAAFVPRGESGFEMACEKAQDLIERRDMSLLKSILLFRKAADEGVTLSTSSGETTAEEFLAELVVQPDRTHNFLRPVSSSRGKDAVDRATSERSGT